MPRFTLEEIRRRKLVQWLLAYAAAAWLLLQLASMLADSYVWPPLVMRALPALLAVGLLGAAIVGWYHGERGAQRASGVEIAMLAGILVIAGVAVQWAREDGRAAASTRDVSVEAAPEQGSIAVLPFVNMSSDPEQEFFSDGLTEELLNVLAQIEGLRVAARTSAFAFKDAHVTVDSIGRALNVAHVVEGSVRRAGERVRITAQLVRTDDGYHVWSDTYDRQIVDVFAVQDEISAAIVEALRLQLGAAAAPGASLHGTRNPEAYTAVLRAKSVMRQRSENALSEAESLLGEAIQLDSSYAEAHAQLAQVLLFQAYGRSRPVDEGYALARESAERALELDPGQPDAHAALGRIADVADWDFRTAADHFRTALERNPSHEVSLTMSAWLQMRLGATDEAIGIARRAVARNPLSPLAHTTLSAMYSYSGQQERSLEQARAALAIAESNSTRGSMAMVLGLMGRLGEASEQIRISLRGEQSNPYFLSVDGYIQARRGNRDAALARARQIEADPQASRYDVAVIHFALGDHDRAFELLEQAVEQHDDIVADLGVDPVFASVRDDPRMHDLLRRIGLPAPRT